MSRASILPVFIPHAGCPNDCVFCDQKSIAGASRAPTPEEVRSLVEEGLAVGHGAPPELAFYGGSFTAIAEDLQDAYLQAAQDALKEGRLSGVRVSTRPDFIDDRILRRLRTAGVTTVELGVQSFDDEVLARSRRGHTAAASMAAARCVRAHGLRLILQLMAGLPGDSRDRAVQSARTAAGLGPDGARIYPVAVLRGTRLAELCRQGAYIPLTLEEAVEISADMLEVFAAQDIPVIRIGLNPSETLKADVLAGAYHPALGELVRGRVFLRAARRALQGVPPGAEAALIVRPSRISALCGQHGENRSLLLREFSLRKLRVRSGDVPDYCVKLDDKTMGSAT